MASIRCAHCKQLHSSVAEVRRCAQQPASVRPPAPVQKPQPAKAGSPNGNGAPRVVYVDAEPTPRQIYTLNNLGVTEIPDGLTRGQAGEMIGRLIEEKKAKQAAVATQAVAESTRAGYPTTTKIPMHMLTSIPKGYYAARQDSTENFTFFRVSRPNYGKYKDCLKIQTQHGENYELCLVVWPSGELTFYRAAAEKNLLLVALSPNSAAIAYGTEIGRCCICNKELTDKRSRWYAIGPECEKSHPGIIHMINETKGEFVWDGV